MYDGQPGCLLYRARATRPCRQTITAGQRELRVNVKERPCSHQAWAYNLQETRFTKACLCVALYIRIHIY